jgi:hypothetical protein
MINDAIRVLIWRFTLVIIQINYGQIGDQTGLFYTTKAVFYTSGNRFVRRTHYVPSNENGNWETRKGLLNCFA